MTENIKHAVELEQCSLFVDSPPLKKSMTDAAEFLRSIKQEIPEEILRRAILGALVSGAPGLTPETRRVILNNALIRIKGQLKENT